MNDSAMQQQPNTQAWYRVGMVWFAFGLPAAVVIASLVTVVIAHKNAPLITPQDAASKTEINVQASPQTNTKP